MRHRLLLAAEFFPDHLRGRSNTPVFGEHLFDNSTFFINQENGRAGNISAEGIPSDMPQTVGVDSGEFGVSEKRKSNTFGQHLFLQVLGRVGADRDQLDASFAKFVFL